MGSSWLGTSEVGVSALLYPHREQASGFRALLSFAPNERGAIKYKTCAGKLAKAAQQQREAVGKRNGTHKGGTSTSSAGGEKFAGGAVNEFFCLGFCRASL